MIEVIGNITDIHRKPEQVSGGIAVNRNRANPLYIRFNAFGAFADQVMPMLSKGDYVYLRGSLVTLPDHSAVGDDEHRERNTVLKAESLIRLGNSRAPGGSGSGLAHAVISGRVGQTPKISGNLKGAEKNFSAANFSIAENHTHVERETGDVIERAEWHRTVVYGSADRNPADALEQGDSVAVSGRVEADSYTTRKGVRINGFSVTADAIAYDWRSIQRATVIGNVGSARSGTDRNGEPYVHCSMAVSPLGGDTRWIEASVFGACARLVEKGRYLYLSGYVLTRETERASVTYRRDALIAERVIPLDTPAKPGGAGIGFAAINAVGNLTRDPDTKVIQASGGDAAVSNVSLAMDSRSNKTHFLDIAVWREAAEILDAHASRGDRIYIHGTLIPSEYEARDGSQVSKLSANVGYVRLM